MRLRVETLPPLPPLKTWLVVTPGIFGLGTKTINDLCKRLISEFGLPVGIQLQHGGFDLYGKDSIESLLDKDDLVHVILKEKSELMDGELSTNSTKAEKVVLGKRKRTESLHSSDDDSSESSPSESESERESEEDNASSESSDEEEEEESDDGEAETRNDGRLIDKTVNQSRSMEDDSESNRESTDSEDSQDSTSSDTESTTSSSSTTSSNEPTILAKPQNLPVKPPVPPGQGLERTRLRNQRKLRVKKLKRLIADGILPENSLLIDLTNYENGLQREYSYEEYQLESPPHIRQSQPEIEEDLSEIKSEGNDGKEKLGPPRRIDVAAVSRFIKAGLVGNDGYDRAREEARIRGKEKKIVPNEIKPEPSLEMQVFIPRTVTSKKQKASDNTIQDGGQVNITEKPQKTHENLTEDLPCEDPLITGFYEQIELATQHRESLSKVVPTSIANNGKPSVVETKPANVVVRAFECEPEWCGLANAQEGEEVDSVEIDPPSLPFVDNYHPQKRRANHPLKTGISSNNRRASTIKKEDASQSSEEEILRLQKLESPIIGADIYFKSVFLHPSRFEPVILWRWGKIISINGDSVNIDVYGPTFKNEGEDEEAEEGEVHVSEESLMWTELLDVRLRMAK